MIASRAQSCNKQQHAFAALLVASCVVVLGASCDRAETSDTSHKSATEPVHIRIEALDRLEVREHSRIDGNVADLVAIRPIRGMAVTSDGDLVVAQAQDHRVLFFDENGEAVAAFGRKGAGPGEFSGIFSLGLLADTLWVWDASLARFTLIDPAREFIRTIPVSKPKLRGEAASDGPAFVLGFPGNGVLVGVGFANGAVLFRGKTTSTSADVLARITSPEDDHFVAFPAGGGTDGNVFGVFAKHDVSADGQLIAIARPFVDDGSSTATVTLLTTDGDTVFHRTLEFAPVPIPTSVVDSATSARTARMNTANAAAFRRGVYLPSNFPAVNGVHIAQGGEVWLRLPETGGTQPYLVLDRSGNRTRGCSSPCRSNHRSRDSWSSVDD